MLERCSCVDASGEGALAARLCVFGRVVLKTATSRRTPNGLGGWGMRREVDK